MTTEAKTNENVRGAKGAKLRGIAITRPGKSKDVVVIGGSPRVSLLPPELLLHAKARRVRRRLGFGVVAALVLVLVVTALASVGMIAAQASLAQKQAEAANLVAEQGKYGDVTKIQTSAQTIKSAQVRTTSAEIEWAPYIQKLEGTLTPGMSITGVRAALSTDATATATPLIGTHIATLAITVSSPQASITDWLVSLRQLPGFVDATPGSVTLQSGAYAVDVDIHVSDAALANRFASTK